MGYWKDVEELLKRGINLAAIEVKEGAETLLEKSREGLVFAQLKKDLYLEHRRLTGLLTEVGDLTYDLYYAKKDIYANEKLKNLMTEVHECEEHCKKLDAQIKKDYD